ncbi:hypothetical protein BCR44DRAFT_207722 [Catenaria anguillulae PL171]|uniref:Uncharacterized protein n=1 Tax=Catenaria anguillulae PL171 TaxID=765915 RepID=A0A1Y2HG55_9FUNG|nr:hypothetical protein BCR44DRAFT_207722 [Catenaria anguillulae PL171]
MAQPQLGDSRQRRHAGAALVDSAGCVIPGRAGCCHGSTRSRPPYASCRQRTRGWPPMARYDAWPTPRAVPESLCAPPHPILPKPFPGQVPAVCPKGLHAVRMAPPRCWRLRLGPCTIPRSGGAWIAEVIRARATQTCRTNLNSASSWTGSRGQATKTCMTIQSYGCWASS